MRDTERPASGELAALAWLESQLPPPEGSEVWFGDDAAVLEVAGETLLFATDVVVEGIHFDRALSSLADVGWKVLVANVSDIAAMGGSPFRAVVGAAGIRSPEVEELYRGLIEAAAQFHCPVVGGDLSDGPSLVISVAILGRCEHNPPILRSGARPGDQLFVTGPLGRSAAGLRELRADSGAVGALVQAHRRPTPRLGEAAAAVAGGATSMMDLSDGLALDLHRLADSSRVGFELHSVPVAPGATEEEALSGGEDYELLFSASSIDRVERAFADASLTPPRAIGAVLSDPSDRLLAGSELKRRGHEHHLA